MVSVFCLGYSPSAAYLAAKLSESCSVSRSWSTTTIFTGDYAPEPHGALKEGTGANADILLLTINSLHEWTQIKRQVLDLREAGARLVLVNTTPFNVHLPAVVQHELGGTCDVASILLDTIALTREPPISPSESVSSVSTLSGEGPSPPRQRFFVRGPSVVLEALNEKTKMVENALRLADLPVTYLASTLFFELRHGKALCAFAQAPPQRLFEWRNEVSRAVMAQTQRQPLDMLVSCVGFLLSRAEQKRPKGQPERKQPERPKERQNGQRPHRIPENPHLGRPFESRARFDARDRPESRHDQNRPDPRDRPDQNRPDRPRRLEPEFRRPVLPGQRRASEQIPTQANEMQTLRNRLHKCESELHMLRGLRSAPVLAGVPGANLRRENSSSSSSGSSQEKSHVSPRSVLSMAEIAEFEKTNWRGPYSSPIPSVPEPRKSLPMNSDVDLLVWSDRKNRQRRNSQEPDPIVSQCYVGFQVGDRFPRVA